MSHTTLPKVAVVRTADAFYSTAELLFSQTPTDIDWPYPYIVNLTLSIELYLKSYISEDDFVPITEDKQGLKTYQGFTKCLTRTHNLKAIYNKIPIQIKKALENEFGSSTLNEGHTTFEEALSQFSNAFVNARYPYEKNSFNGACLSDLKNISKFLKASIYKLDEFHI